MTAVLYLCSCVDSHPPPPTITLKSIVQLREGNAVGREGELDSVRLRRIITGDVLDDAEMAQSLTVCGLL